jgi:hypothetical protein
VAPNSPARRRAMFKIDAAGPRHDGTGETAGNLRYLSRPAALTRIGQTLPTVKPAEMLR